MIARGVAAALASVLVLAACGGDGRPGPASPQPGVNGSASAAAVRERLCTRPEPLPPSAAPHEGALLPYMRDVMATVEDVRGLAFIDPVVPEAISRTDLDARSEDGFAMMYPSELYGRRSLVWQTIGAIPEGTDLREAYHAFYNVAVLGFYDTLTGELVFLGTDDPMPEERVTLAHELVHALDDQWFDLSRIDRLLADCQEEAFQAALAVLEGSAAFYTERYEEVALTSEERASFGWTPIPDVPSFLIYEMGWPYEAGLDWARWAVDNGHLDAGLGEFPTTTEQILHPERRLDEPTPLDIPDLGPALGDGWDDLDVEDAGESWLASLLGTALDTLTTQEATAGWDGGLLRSWTDGDHVAVVLATAWDFSRDAAQFARAMESYGWGRPIEVIRDPATPTLVRVLFASDAATLDLLRSGAAAPAP